MARMLTRSRSLRFLRGNHKAREYEDDVLPPPRAIQTELDRYFTASPIMRAERNLEALDIATRPSTSDGVSDRSTKMFHLKSLHGSPSVRPHDLSIASQSPSKQSSVLYSTAEVTPGSGVIGIALGSPTTGSHWNATPLASANKLDLSPTDDQPQPNKTQMWESSREEPPRPKISRWKSLFKKAPPPPPSPPEKPGFYQVVTTVTAGGRAGSLHDSESLQSQVSIRREGDFSKTLSPPLFKSDIRESRKGDADESSTSQPRTRGRAVTAPPTSVPEVVVSENIEEPFLSSPGGRLLDVAIPDVKMERYSVMFSSLLQANSNQSSSLLARRQGLSEKLGPLNELSVKEEEPPIDDKVPWTASTPTVIAPSPRLSLFPSANSSRAPSPRLASAPRAERIRERSRTAPSKSPLVQEFSQSTGEEKKERATASTLKPKAAPVAKSPHPPRVDSFEYCKDLTVNPLKVVKQEPAPTPVANPAANPAAIPAATPVTSSTMEAVKAPKFPPRSDSRQPVLTKTSALSSHPSSSPIEVTSPLQRIQSLSSPTGSGREARRRGDQGKQAAKTTPSNVETAPKPVIGIARSVSLSRANNPRAPARTMTNPGMAKSPTAERVVQIDKRALTPTMVEMSNRQSHCVQLVDV